MDRATFLDLIFGFFKVKDEYNSLKQSYDIALTTKKNIDWQAMYIYVLKNVESRYLPPPKWFLSKMKCFECIAQGGLDGYKVRVYYKSGRITEFVVISDVETSLQKIIFNSKNTDNIVKAELYDQNVTFIGNNVYPDNAEFKVIYSNT